MYFLILILILVLIYYFTRIIEGNRGRRLNVVQIRERIIVQIQKIREEISKRKKAQREKIRQEQEKKRQEREEQLGILISYEKINI